jgi:hypothetical protein
LHNGDQIFGLAFAGKSTTGGMIAAGIQAEVSGTVGDDILPGALDFATATSAGVLTTKLKIGPNGKQTIVAPALTPGIGSGQVDANTILAWMSVNFNGVEYAVPMYKINA